MASTEIKFELPKKIEERLTKKETPYAFSRNAQKSDVFNKPLLIIGLGGSGYAALSRAKEKMVSCFKTNNQGELEGVEFLEIDTDDKDMRDCLENPKPGSLTENEFMIFQNADIGAILRSRERNSDILPEEIAEWLDPNIPVAQIVHGAAGIRQAGRLLLHLNAVEIIDVIKVKLDKIRQSVVLSKSPVNVVILTGLGGGTGSGTFVDVSYIVRECIKDFSGQAFITGIMLMPDILAADPNVDKNTRENIKRNGFAALKELDHLMNLSETQDTFAQRYPGGFLVEETNEAIFDRCVLVSSMIEGRLLLPRAKEHAYNISAEMLIDMVSNSSIVSKGSNDVSRRDNALTNMKNRKPVNYVYTAVGGQAVYFDFDLVFNLFVKNVLEYEGSMSFTTEQIEEFAKKELDEKGIDAAISDLVKERDKVVVDSRKLFEIVPEGKTGKHISKSITLEYIKDHCDQKYILVENSKKRGEIDNDLKIFDDKADIIYKKLQVIKAEIEDEYEECYPEIRGLIQSALSETMENPENGTEESEREKYAKKIEAYRKDCQNRKRKGKEPREWMKKLGIGKEMEIEKTSSALSRISKQEAELLKHEAYNRTVIDLIGKVSDLFVTTRKESSEPASKEMADFYSKARTTWEKILKEKYDINYSKDEIKKGDRFAQESIEEAWERNDVLFGKASILAGVQTKKKDPYGFRSITVPKYIETLDSLIKETHKKEVGDAAREYKKIMTDKTFKELYQGEANISPVIATGLIFENSFEHVSISLDDVIMEIFGIKRCELEDVWRVVVKEILGKSGVLYSKKAMKDGEVFERPSYNEFMIPRSNNKILAAAYKELTGQEAEESEIKHRVSCMKYTQCQKIDDYIYIDELEKVYNRSNSKCGLHLYENNEILWAKLPSPVYRNRHADYLRMNEYDDALAAEKYRYIFYRAFDKEHRYFNDPDHGIIAYDTDAKKMRIDVDLLKQKLKELNDKKALEDEKYKKYRDMLTKKTVYICNVEYNESRSKMTYVEYCADWFIKMFNFRDLVATALQMPVTSIDEDKLSMFA